MGYGRADVMPAQMRFPGTPALTALATVLLMVVRARRR